MTERDHGQAYVPGEGLDGHTQSALQLVHTVVGNAKEFQRQHKKFIGTTAIVATTAYLIANFAINKYLNDKPGCSDEEIILSMTDQHLKEAEKEWKEVSKVKGPKAILQKVLKPHIH